jgi:transketolase
VTIYLKEKIDQPIFDTLQYAQQLRIAGIEHAEECSRALSDALRQNINTKNEVDKMFAKALEESNKQLLETRRLTEELSRRSEERTNEMRRESAAELAAFEKRMAEEGVRFEKAQEKDRARHKEEMLQAEINLQKAVTPYLITTISTLGTLIVMVGTFAAFSQHLFALVR